MAKALLIGSAPKLQHQLEGIPKSSLVDYDAICCVNNVFNEDVRKLHTRYEIEADYYFFSDWTFTSHPHGHRIPSLSVDNKILCTPPEKQRAQPLMNSKIKAATNATAECSVKVGETIDYLGGYASGTWASTGMYSLGYLLLQEKFDTVDIVGFSFFEGQVHYYEKGEYPSSGRHNSSSEIKIYEHFNRAKRCFSL
jgi:hypothetical protein